MQTRAAHLCDHDPGTAWPASRVGRRRSDRGAHDGGEPVRVGSRSSTGLLRSPAIGSSRCSAHPSDLVRFCATALSSRYPALARRHIPELTHDASPQRPGGCARDPSSNAVGGGAALLAPPSRRSPSDGPRQRVSHGDGDRRTSGSTLPRHAARRRVVVGARGGPRGAGGRRARTSSRSCCRCSRPTTPSSGHAPRWCSRTSARSTTCSRQDAEHRDAERILAAGSRRLRDAAASRAQLGSSTRHAARDRLGAGAVSTRDDPPGRLVLGQRGVPLPACTPATLALMLVGFAESRRSRREHRFEDLDALGASRVLAVGQRPAGRLQRGRSRCRTPSARFSSSTTPSSR